MLAEIARLKDEQTQLRHERDLALAKAKTRPATPISCRVSTKGCLSVYGLGRFPVSLYKSQWLRLLDAVDYIRSFMDDNDEYLAKKEAEAE